MVRRIISRSRSTTMQASRSALWQIHFCVVLWGFTAILGKLITLPALPLVLWRMSLVAVLLLLLPKVWRGLAKLSLRQIAIYAAIGVVIALHWLTFYGAIKLSNASVAVTCIALAPVFLAVIEPLVARRSFDSRELLLGVAVIPGVALVVGGIPHDMQIGVLVGIASAFFVAVFTSLNKRHVERADSATVTTIELGAGALFLALIAPLLTTSGDAVYPVPGRNDALLLIVLSVVCTLLPFIVSLRALRHVSAFTAQMAVNLEPIYAIVLAMLLLGEQHELDRLFYVGVAIVLGAVFLQPLLARRSLPVAPIQE